MKQNIILIDLDRCIGCRGGCQAACKTRHNIALGPSRSKLYSMGPTGVYPRLSMYFMPVMCQQCAEPACAKVCPTAACYKSSADGVVYIERDRCVGCQSCLKACPYEANFFNHELRVTDKCDICGDWTLSGEPPACVRNCSGAAIHFGDANDPQSTVSLLMTQAGPQNIYALPDYGTRPGGRYILRNAAWLDVLPHKFACQKGDGHD